ncbi:MAG: hypothetical protein ACFCA4_01165 [Cyanophyceae cyanobacterium]
MATMRTRKMWSGGYETKVTVNGKTHSGYGSSAQQSQKAAEAQANSSKK